MVGKENTNLNQEILSIIHSYHQALRQAGIPLDDLLLFGSHAKGTAHRWSDIDLAVVAPQFGHDSFDERIMLMQLSRGISDLIEPHPFHPDDLNNRWSTIAQEIKKYGIRIE